MNVIKHQRERRPSISTHDGDDGPPAYPTDEDLPLYSNINLGVHQADGRPACKGGREDARNESSIAGSSETLVELMTLPDIANGSGDDGKDRDFLGL